MITTLRTLGELEAANEYREPTTTNPNVIRFRAADNGDLVMLGQAVGGGIDGRGVYVSVKPFAFAFHGAFHNLASDGAAYRIPESRVIEEGCE